MTTKQSTPLPSRAKDLTGLVFGRWTAERYAGKSHWWCRCKCGTVRRVFIGGLSSGTSRSCGCLRDELASKRSSTHRLTKTPEYKTWAGIKRRCQNTNDKAYPAYGGSGVTVCKRWSDSFEAFLCDMGPKPSPSHTIDRIDNSRGYEPGNCRWATKEEQAANKTNNRLITFDGKTHHSAEWERITGIRRSTIEYRLNHGWSVEAALTTPVVIGRNQNSTP